MKRIALVALTSLLSQAAFAGFYEFQNTSSKLLNLEHGEAVTWGLGGGDYTNLLSDLGNANSYVSAASLTLYKPRDWRSEPKDVLYINILNGLDVGTDSTTYNPYPSNYDSSYGPNAFEHADAGWAGWFHDNAHDGLNFNDPQSGSLLKADGMPGDLPGTWTDLDGPYGSNANTDYIDNVTISFTQANLDLLQALLTGASQTVGLGFAAECHYYFDKVKLKISTDTLPGTPPPPSGVPDAGSVVTMLGLGLLGLAGARRFLK